MSWVRRDGGNQKKGLRNNSAETLIYRRLALLERWYLVQRALTEGLFTPRQHRLLRELGRYLRGFDAGTLPEFIVGELDDLEAVLMTLWFPTAVIEDEQG